jgi:RHS repeat-associated protein
VKCFPKPERKEGFCLPCYLKGAWSNFFQKVFSSVNLVMREYVREEPDLSVKVPGGIIEAKRWYFGNGWRWEHFRHNLKFNLGSLGNSIETVEKDEVLYKASSTDSSIFSHEFYRIIKTGEEWRWEHKNGDWKRYDAAGNMTAYGTRTGTVGKLIYENGWMVGIADRNDNQVLWYEYDGNQISAVSDIKNRRVVYGYTNGRLSSATNVIGGTTRFEYDTKGRIDKIIDAENFNSIVVYDSYGHIASVVDSNGEGHFFEYDYDEGTKETYVRIRSSAGKIREIWFDRNNEPIRVDVNGRTVQKILRDGRDLIITDENSRVTRKEYDEWENLTRIIYPDGTTANYEYERNFNRKIKETNEQSVITEFNYDENGNLIRKTEAVDTIDERVTEYAYNGEGNLLTTRRLADGNSAEALTATTYDEAGNLSSITDPQGGIIRFTSHDIMGNVLTKIDARGKEWTYEYDSAGRLTSVTNPIVNATTPYRNVTRIFYDQVGNKIREIDPVGKETLYEYDAHRNLIQVADNQGNFSRFEYNEDGKLVRQIDPEGKFIRFEHDSDGRLLKTIDGNGNEIAMDYGGAAGIDCSSCSGENGAADQPSRVIYPTFEKHFSYDKRGRKLIETDMLGETESYVSKFSYDDIGNLVTRTDREQNTTAYAYDYLNRLVRVTDAVLKDTIYTYDNRDNLIALTDAENNTTRFEYDLNGLLKKEIRPGGQQTSYEYDRAGNLTKKIDAKDQKTEYKYDDAGRLVEIRYFESSDYINPVKSVTFTYDRVGNLTGYNDGITSAIYMYDDLYRKLSETLNYGSFELGYSYTYNRNGLKQTFTNPDGLTYEYTYDDDNQLVGVQIPEVGYITHSAYKWNRPEEVLFPGGSRRQYDYDPLMRVKSITAEDPGRNILMQYQYDYDKVSNIIEKSTGHGDYVYQYDALYRLRNADTPGQSDEAFTYDAVGNRLTSAITTGTWSYNQNNELQHYDDVSYVYDANGNMTQKTASGAVTSYTYNVENRLERVEDGSGSLIATYYYDPFGRRLWKEVGGVKTYFFYADEGLIGEYDQAGAEIKTYGYKPGSTWTTDPLFMKVGAEYYFYQNDHLGTPQKLTAVNGAVVWSAEYSSFGETTVDVETVENNLRFPGQYYDDETELYYNYHRYYDFKIARYLKVDPIGLSGGLNLFIYSDQNSINIFDPFGLFCRIEGTPGVGPRIGDTWIESQKIGYWNAMPRRVAWEIFKVKFNVPPIPGEAEDKMAIFKYRVRYTEYEHRLIVTEDFYVCYDDCTKQEISREHIGQGNFGKTKVVIIRAYEIDKYIGDSKEYNRKDDVDPLVIEF